MSKNDVACGFETGAAKYFKEEVRKIIDNRDNIIKFTNRVVYTREQDSTKLICRLYFFDNFEVEGSYDCSDAERYDPVHARDCAYCDAINKAYSYFTFLHQYHKFVDSM